MNIEQAMEKAKSLSRTGKCSVAQSIHTGGTKDTTFVNLFIDDIQISCEPTFEAAFARYEKELVGKIEEELTRAKEKVQAFEKIRKELAEKNNPIDNGHNCVKV